MSIHHVNVVLLVVVVMASAMCNALNIKMPSPVAGSNSVGTDVYYQDYLYLGKECNLSALSRLTVSPIYKTTDSCIQTSKDNYQKSYCTSNGFVTESDCAKDCTSCSTKSEHTLFPTCTEYGIASTIRICGKMLSEDLPKILWNVEYDNCESKKTIQAKGFVADQCEWSLLQEPLKRTCNSTDYSVETFTGGVTECKTRIGVSTGKVGVCSKNTEYKCQ